MAELFSDEWMKAYMQAWNADPELAEALAAINFTSTIAYGFDTEELPSGVLVVENGRVVKAGKYQGEDLNWDLRATRDSWDKWLNKGIGMMGLGIAYTTGKLKFKIGDYMAMVKDPRMAGPFIKSFTAMGQVK
ncbi:MAG: hypothetical protein RL368_1208 [Pseudomonadota bacterium]|jgi:hypothetical protein